MRIVSSVISVHSSDTAGVNSALYELGGMCVVHDASGCNSTYTTHDEPRWYHQPGRTYISALTENDVIMGNDERFIDNVVKSAANFPRCRFIAICGSPLPMITTWPIRSPAALAIMTICPIISPALRSLAFPPIVEAQNLQPIAQPTSEERQIEQPW